MQSSKCGSGPICGSRSRTTYFLRLPATFPNMGLPLLPCPKSTRSMIRVAIPRPLTVWHVGQVAGRRDLRVWLGEVGERLAVGHAGELLLPFGGLRLRAMSLNSRL